MPARAIRVSLLTVLLSLGIAATASALHPPSQHDQQRISIEDALIGTNLTQQIAQSQSFECQNGMAGPYPCRNVDLAGYAPMPMLGGAQGNDIWGWKDPQTGKEYALMGTSHSMGFVDVTDPYNPVIVGTLPTRGIPDDGPLARHEDRRALAVRRLGDHRSPACRSSTCGSCATRPASRRRLRGRCVLRRR